MAKNQESKFNFTEDDNDKNQSSEQVKEDIKKEAKGLFKSSTIFLKDLLDFH